MNNDQNFGVSSQEAGQATAALALAVNVIPVYGQIASLLISVGGSIWASGLKKKEQGKAQKTEKKVAAASKALAKEQVKQEKKIAGKQLKLQNKQSKLSMVEQTVETAGTQRVIQWLGVGIAGMFVIAVMAKDNK